MTSTSVQARRRAWTLGVLGATALGLLSFVRYWMDDLARGHAPSPLEPLIEEMTGAFGAFLQWVWVVPFVRRHRLDAPGWPRRIPLHLGAALVFSAIHTTWNWLTRELLWPAAGLGDYDYGILPLRYLMELPMDLFIYAAIVASVTGLDRYRAARERERAALVREARLARMQLQLLRSQLQPHFLFNALNTISSVMYEDVAAADGLLARLSELLRRTLRTGESEEISLQEELEVLAPYLDLIRGRFGDRLAVRVELDEALRSALVPALVLQPLVENAVKHGMRPAAQSTVTLRARREGDELALEVEDDGPGLPDGAVPGNGIGLANTVERLRRLYGEAGVLSWHPVAGGGLLVRVRLPYHETPVTAEPAWISAS